MELLTVDLNSKDVAKQIYSACTHTGFFYLSGLDDEFLEAKSSIFSQLEHFFSLDLTEKLKLTCANNSVGFIPMGSEGSYGVDAFDRRSNVEPEDLRDYKETFRMSLDLPESHPNYHSELFGTNVFPANCELFKPAAEKYFQECRKLSRVMFKYFATSLNLKEDYFDAFLNNPMISMNMNFYPPVVGNSNYGIGTHTDFDCFTLLAVDDVPGLEVYGDDGNFHKILGKPDCIIVNVADMLARWTNGLYKSSIHRVLNNSSSKNRYSIAFFANVDFDTKISSLVNHSENPEVVIAGEHLLERLRRIH